MIETMAKCSECGNVFFVDRSMLEQVDDVVIDVNCQRLINAVQVFSTMPIIPGYSVVRTKGLVTARAAVGMNVFREAEINAANVLGGRSRELEGAIQSGEQHVLGGLKLQAYKMKCNAVANVSLQLSELSGKSSMIVMLLAAGTAVILQKDNA